MDHWPRIAYRAGYVGPTDTRHFEKPAYALGPIGSGWNHTQDPIDAHRMGTDMGPPTHWIGYLILYGGYNALSSGDAIERPAE